MIIGWWSFKHYKQQKFYLQPCITLLLLSSKGLISYLICTSTSTPVITKNKNLTGNRFGWSQKFGIFAWLWVYHFANTAINIDLYLRHEVISFRLEYCSFHTLNYFFNLTYHSQKFKNKFNLYSCQNTTPLFNFFFLNFTIMDKCRLNLNSENTRLGRKPLVVKILHLLNLIIQT